MKYHKKLFDTLQFIGLLLGVLSIINHPHFSAKQDLIGSIILGLGVTISFQIFDLQQRQSGSEETILRSNALILDIY
jgi:hypothetical protein